MQAVGEEQEDEASAALVQDNKAHIEQHHKVQPCTGLPHSHTQEDTADTFAARADNYMSAGLDETFSVGHCRDRTVPIRCRYEASETH